MESKRVIFVAQVTTLGNRGTDDGCQPLEWGGGGVGFLIQGECLTGCFFFFFWGGEKNHILNSIKTGWWQLKYFLFLPLPEEMIKFDEHIFQMGWNHQLEKLNGTWLTDPCP